MKIEIYNADITKTTFKVNRRTLSYDELYAELVAQEGLKIASITQEQQKTIKDRIASIHTEHSNQINAESIQAILNVIEEYIPPYIKQLNSVIVDGFRKYIAWASDKNGNAIWLIRTDSNGNTWTLAEDILRYVRGNKIDNMFIIEHLSRFYYASALTGGPIQYKIINTEDGKWGKSITKYELYREGAKIAYEKKMLTGDECATALASIGTKIKSSDMQPFTSVFSNTSEGWLWQMWQQSTDTVMPMPVTITNDPTKPAFSFVDLKNISDGPTPDFDGWLEAFPEESIGPFMASIYVSVCETAHISQLIWLTGNGNDGKSTLFKALGKAFGESMMAPISAKDVTSDFGLESAIGKRIVFVGDLQSGNFLGSNFVHAVTGGDSVNVNRKNEKHINHEFKTILFVGSNTPPEVNMLAYNEARRIFYIPLHEPSINTMRKYCQTDSNGNIMRYKNGMPMYNGYPLADKLVAEMPHILYKCKKMYDKYYGHGTLMLPESVFDYMLDKLSSNMVDIFEKFFMDIVEIVDNATVPAINVVNAYLAYTHGNNAVNNPNAYNFEIRDLKRALKNTFATEPHKVTYEGKRVNCYTGLRLRMDKINSARELITMNAEQKTPNKEVEPILGMF